MTTASAEPLLSLRNVEVVYDNVSLAVSGVSLDVPEGQLIALLGANGAGKSTTLRSISGLLQAARGKVTRGEIRYAGQLVNTLSPQDRVKLGIVQVLEGRHVFEQLTTNENLEAACPVEMSRAEMRSALDRAYTFFPRLAERRNATSGYLSGGEQQMLAIARALMTRPRMLMLDEPSLGLSPMLTTEIFSIIRRINREEGISVLLVEQNAFAALDLVSHGYLIESGRVVMHDTATAMKNNPDIQEFYLGGHGVNFRDIKHYRRRKRWLT
ncbi:branched-chain amino acid ABC transporter ATP-binding protein [Oceanicola sp. 22II-s10i]|uniref:ABC transporter ATP-binding protein n=1 Tax=Oceanicola sp. 22II-s10i TaxID=1317116 RepID=UPI000B51EDEE|nr:ABC transporter ATP-binding protein [Oceanicola sp. 22II-s10i]OWU83133.1 branched-chain amino acid ABC transporter ATP-binding protein [Oceanicola sp. 22II-s10i]